MLKPIFHALLLVLQLLQVEAHLVLHAGLGLLRDVEEQLEERAEVLFDLRHLVLAVGLVLDDFVVDVFHSLVQAGEKLARDGLLRLQELIDLVDVVPVRLQVRGLVSLRALLAEVVPEVALLLRANILDLRVAVLLANQNLLAIHAPVP